MRILILILSLFLSFSLQADYKKYEMNPPKAKAINARRLERQKPLMLYKFQGYIGETEQGILAVHDLSKAPKAEQPAITKMMKAENKDRILWYKEVIAFNKLSAKEKDFLIKSAFDTFKGTDAKGTYFYENKQWQKKY